MEMSRVAGVDLGAVRVGLAVSDDLGLMAHPRPHRDGRDLLRLAHALRDWAAEEQVGRFVVGLPRTLDGREGPAARRARRFAELLARVAAREVVLHDEWLTTREAQARLREQGVHARAARQKIDSAAAAVLLQSWLDAARGGAG